LTEIPQQNSHVILLRIFIKNSVLKISTLENKYTPNPTEHGASFSAMSFPSSPTFCDDATDDNTYLGYNDAFFGVANTEDDYNIDNNNENDIDNSNEGDIDDSNNNVNKRQSYSREYKISVLNWHRENGLVKNKTARHFNISHQNVIRWVRAEVEIRKGKKGTKRQGSGRTAMYPLLEQRLHKEFLDLRKKGVKIRSIWFTTR
jgi:transposase-like protein